MKKQKRRPPATAKEPCISSPNFDGFFSMSCHRLHFSELKCLDSKPAVETIGNSRLGYFVIPVQTGIQVFCRSIREWNLDTRGSFSLAKSQGGHDGLLDYVAPRGKFPVSSRFPCLPPPFTLSASPIDFGPPRQHVRRNR